MNITVKEDFISTNEKKRRNPEKREKQQQKCKESHFKNE